MANVLSTDDSHITVLHVAPITSAAAVRAAIVQEFKSLVTQEEG